MELFNFERRRRRIPTATLPRCFSGIPFLFGGKERRYGGLLPVYHSLSLLTSNLLFLCIGNRALTLFDMDSSLTLAVDVALNMLPVFLSLQEMWPCAGEHPIMHY